MPLHALYAHYKSTALYAAHSIGWRSQESSEVPHRGASYENQVVAGQICVSYRLTPTGTGVRSSTEHAPWLRQNGCGGTRLSAVAGDQRGGATEARDDLLLRRSPRDAGALARRGPRGLWLAIPIQLLLFPVAVPLFFEGLDLGGGLTRIPP